MTERFRSVWKREPDREIGTAAWWRELIPALCGTAAAIAAAFGLAPLGIFRQHSWPKLIVAGVVILTCTAQAGALAQWIVDSAPRQRGRGGNEAPSLLSGWLLLPSAALLLWEGSFWGLAVAAACAVVIALRLRRTLPAEVTFQSVPNDRGEFGSFYGMPAADTWFLHGLGVALLAQAAAFSLVRGHLTLTAALLASGLFLFVWRWTAVQSRATKRLMDAFSAKRVVPAAVVLTVVAMLSWDTFGLYKFGGGRGGGPGGAPRHVVAPVLAAERGGDYVGVVLWPPPLKKRAIVPPKQMGEGPGAKSKPVVIPFDGPYWYFKFPNSGPGRFAHVVRGKTATQVNIASTSWTPLQTEAHQNVGLPIELSCCRAIEVSVENADHEQGGVAVGLVLTDSSGPVKRSVNLGFKTVLSSETEDDRQENGPVAETLRFPMPRTPKIRKFDAITVLFMPSASHARQGAKVAVKSFTLVP